MKLKLLKAPSLVLATIIAFGLPLSATAATTGTAIMKRPKLSASMLKSQQLLKEGQAKAATEETLGTDPNKRKQKPTGEGSDAKEESLALPTTSSPAIKMNMLSPARSFTINKQNYFNTPIKTPARKQMFQYSGIKNLNVKAMTISAEDQKSLKVNKSILMAGKANTNVRTERIVPDTTIKTVKVLKPAAQVAQPQPAPKPDVAITKVEWINDQGQARNLTAINKSSKGTWLKFRVYVKNQAQDRSAIAYRVDITAEHISGMDWPTTDFHLIKIKPQTTNVIVIEVLVPQNAVVKSGHQIKFTADKEQVNEDMNPNNNSVRKTFTLLPPVEPDLYIRKFERKRTDSAKDWGAIKRGWIQYKYNVEVGNRGNAVSPQTKVALKIQKVDHRDNHPEPYLHKDWSYQIPALNKGAFSAFTTGKWKVYTAQTCKVDGVIDPDNRITESDKNNNLREAKFTVSVKNPFAGTFLAGLWEAGYDAFLKVGNAVFDGVTWAYNGIKAGSQYALAGVITPEMIAWVELSHATHKNLARPLTSAEKQMLAPMFPQSFINDARIHIVNSWARPELWGDGAGVTFKNVIVIQKGKLNNKILVHEMVHSYQYKKLGLPKFCWRYIYTWVKAKFSYMGISLEKQAYGFDGAYTAGRIERIEDYLGY